MIGFLGWLSERGAQEDVAHADGVRAENVSGFGYHGLILFTTASSLRLPHKYRISQEHETL